MVENNLKIVGIKSAAKEEVEFDSVFVYFYMPIRFGESLEKLKEDIKVFGAAYSGIKPTYEVEFSEIRDLDDTYYMKRDNKNFMFFNKGTLFAIKIKYPMLMLDPDDFDQMINALNESFSLFINRCVKDLN